MANYICTARTNYFTVKDEQAFRDDMANYSVEVVQNTNGQLGLLNDDGDGGGWPCWVVDEATQEDIEIDFFNEVGKHLIDDEVAIFMEAGAEKMRYVFGCSVAVNNKGKQVIISLGEIYKKARKLTKRPDDITVCEF